MKIGILGGGVAGINVAKFLDKKNDITILESSKSPGGLAASYEFDGFYYDVGPHIIFSKNKEVLEYMLSIDDQLMPHQRSNQIWYKGSFIKYPFENYLGLLDDSEKETCLNSFLNNPYKDYTPTNMQQFFLKKFGSGITETYLGPYNKKIWKYDPTFLDLQMVERIPSPPAQDVIDGANSKFKEGYTHQSCFYYPKTGGIQTFFNKMSESLSSNCKLLKDHMIVETNKKLDNWEVKCANGKKFTFDKIINCMPIHNFVPTLKTIVPDEINNSIAELKYNSMYCGIIIFSEDKAGDNFSLNIPSDDIIFHRISKINFLGEGHPKNKSAFLYEITFRKDMLISKFKKEQIKNLVIEGFEKMKLAKKEDFLNFDMKRIDMAYVIYDLHHRNNVDNILKYFESLGISSCGRFAEFEYVNMDHVIERAMKLSNSINSKG